MRGRARTKKFGELTAFRMGVLLWVISDIQMALTNVEDPVDVRNEPQLDTRSQVVRSSNYFVWALSSHFRSLLRKPDL